MFRDISYLRVRNGVYYFELKDTDFTTEISIAGNTSNATSEAVAVIVRIYKNRNLLVAPNISRYYLNNIERYKIQNYEELIKIIAIDQKWIGMYCSDAYSCYAQSIPCIARQIRKTFYINGWQGFAPGQRFLLDH